MQHSSPLDPWALQSAFQSHARALPGRTDTGNERCDVSWECSASSIPIPRTHKWRFYFPSVSVHACACGFMWVCAPGWRGGSTSKACEPAPGMECSPRFGKRASPSFGDPLLPRGGFSEPLNRHLGAALTASAPLTILTAESSPQETKQRG